MIKSRRILHAASFGYKAKGVFLHGVSTKLSNGWTRGGHNVLNFSDRDVARWMSLGVRWLGRRRAAATLRDLCLSIRPDVLALGHADSIDAQTVAELREKLPDMKVLQWNVDWLLPPDYGDHLEQSGAQNLEKILNKAPVVDATFVSTAGPALAHLASRVGLTGFLPNPVDPSLETARNFERVDTPFDLFFASGSEDPRRLLFGEACDIGRLVTEIGRASPQTRISAHGVNGAPPVFGPSYQGAMEDCVIGLNISRHNDVDLYSSDRLAHLAGNGLAVLMDRSSGYDTLFSRQEFAFFSSRDELIDNVRRLTEDVAHRRSLGQAGWRRYHALFDARIVAQYMLDVVYGEHDSRRYEWPTVVGSAPGVVAARPRIATAAL